MEKKYKNIFVQQPNNFLILKGKKYFYYLKFYEKLKKSLIRVK
jgi:hypothetical protein